MPSSCASEYPPAQQQQYVVRQVRPAQKLEERSAQDEREVLGTSWPIFIGQRCARSRPQLNARKKESLAGLERARLARPVRFPRGLVARNQGAYFSLAFTGASATPFGSAGFTGFLRGEQRGGSACVGWS